MSWSIVWSERALQSLELKIDYLHARNPGAARRLVERLLRRVEDLRKFPYQGPPWAPAAGQGVRRLVADDHILYYLADSAQRQIILLAVRHGREQPPGEDDLR